MLSYCLKCKKNTESINPKVLKATNDDFDKMCYMR